MSGVLRKFVPRAPRYTLRPGDSQVLIFAGERPHALRHTTKILNISASGIAFLVEAWNAPKINDHIKIEFPIPGADQVAWWAKVVRIQSYTDARWWEDRDTIDSDKFVMVAVTYINLPQGHAKQLQTGLDKMADEIRREYWKDTFRDYRDAIARNMWNFILFGLCVAASLVALKMFNQYEHMFDRKEGSVYFEFFKDWDF